MRGVLNAYKPKGPSSYDIIRDLKQLLSGARGPGSESKVPGPESLPVLGHAGTLDPMATGVLVILVGEATRLSRFFLLSDKEYEAEVLFGKQTDTDDVTGRTVAEEPVPELGAEELRATLGRFVGQIIQVPPKFSALKQDGVPQYRLARRGFEPEPRPRTVTVHSLALLDWSPPKARLHCVVSSGTYVRSLARDIGKAAGSVACLSGLVRTRCGRFTLADSISVEEASAEAIQQNLVQIDEALPALPLVEVTDEIRTRLRHGQKATFELDEAVAGSEYLLARTQDRRFLCLARPVPGGLRSERLIYAD